MKSKTIELNGNHYDAVTGKLLIHIQGDDEQQVTIATHATSRAINHARAHAPQAPAPRIHKIAVSAPKSASFAIKTPKNANHATAHPTQHAVTLRRDAVQKPSPSLVRQLHPKAALAHTKPDLIIPKASASTINPTRLERAFATERSPHIARHTAPQTNITPSIVSLDVAPMPVKPEEREPVNTPAPMPTNKPTDTQKPTDIFEHALANAAHYVDVRAHSQNYKRKVRTHMLSMAAGTLALVIIAGFAAYQNTPGLQVKFAGVQAGVSTRMPNFAAAGFAYEGVKANSGKLTMGFSGTNGDFRLTQQASNMSAENMIQTVGSHDASGRPIYKAVQVGNTTVYRFANNDATWIADGSWYSLSGTGSLTDDQVSSLVRNI